MGGLKSKNKMEKTEAKQKIESHFKKFCEKQDRRNFLGLSSKYGAYSSSFGLSDYCRILLDKAKLLSEDTRKEIYEVLGDLYNGAEVYTLARRYYLMAGRPQLLERVRKMKSTIDSIFDSDWRPY